jgi:Tol biopolymer transport system component
VKHNLFGWSVTLAILLLSALPPIQVGYAQDNSIANWVAVQDLQGIHFYSVNTSGELVLVYSLPPDFRVGDPDDTHTWFIREQTNFMVSPDGTQVAFTAEREQEGALFIYTVQQNDLQQYAIPVDLKPVWSPDSDRILFSACCEGATSNDDYVYDIRAQQIISVDTGEVNGSHFQWVSDSTGLVYVAGSQLMFVSRDGKTQHVLTDIRSQVPPDIASLEICNLTWSDASQRYYYTVGCIGGGEEPNEYVYSVDLAGNNRAETSMGTATIYADDSYIDVVDLHPVATGNGVYITLRSQDGSQSPDGLLRRRILRVDNPGEISIVYEEKRDEDVSKSVMSPDNNYIALVSSASGSASGPTSDGLLQVIDVHEGQAIAEVVVTPQAVCDAQWSDDTTLLYSIDPSGICDVKYSKQSTSVWQLNLLTGISSNLISASGGMSWLLPTFH